MLKCITFHMVSLFGRTVFAKKMTFDPSTTLSPGRTRNIKSCCGILPPIPDGCVSFIGTSVFEASLTLIGADHLPPSL